jgi:hypothetical protein
MFLLLLAAVLAIPLGLDLYMPIPEDNPDHHRAHRAGGASCSSTSASRAIGRIACASCHDPERAFTDGRPVAIGVYNRIGRRSAPVLVNRGYGRSFLLDGRAATLEEPGTPADSGSQ